MPLRASGVDSPALEPRINISKELGVTVCSSARLSAVHDRVAFENMPGPDLESGDWLNSLTTTLNGLSWCCRVGWVPADLGAGVGISRTCTEVSSERELGV